MATVIISTPFRDSFSHIRFTFQLPQLSLKNPLLFLQTLGEDANQLIAIGGGMILALWMGITAFFNTLGNITSQSRLVFDPQPGISLMGNSVLAIENFFLHLGIAVIQFISTLFFTFIRLTLISEKIFISGVIWAVNSINQTLTIDAPIVSTTISIAAQAIVKFIIVAAQGITTIVGTIFFTILKVFEVIFQFIFSILDAIWNWITSVVRAIVHEIEIPFKLLGAFFVAMQPYFDFFGRHVQLVGQDFSHGAKSLNDAASYVSNSK